MKALRQKSRRYAWLTLPAALIVGQLFVRPESSQSPLLMAGGLAGLCGLSLMSERWRRSEEGVRDTDEPLADSVGGRRSR